MQYVEPEELRDMAAYLGPIITGGSCEIMVRQVPVPFLESVWPHVVDLISHVVDRTDGEWTIDDLAGRLLRGEWQLWTVYDGTVRAVIGTSLAPEPSGALVAHVLWASGSRAEDWMHLISDIEAWASDQGAAKLKMLARKGYPKRFKELFASYKLSHVLLEKDLRNGQ